MHSTTRRQFVKQAAASIGGLAILGPTQIFAKASLVKIGVYAPSHCALPIVYAYHNNVLKNNGVNAEIVYCSGMPDIMKKLITGEIHFAQLMSPMVFQMHAGQMKAPQKSLAVTQVLGTNGGILGISSQSNIKKVQDLAGKSIGVHSPLMVHNLILTLLLEKYGLNKNNINIQTVPMNQIRDALVQKKIDAFINPEPLPTLLESQKISKSLLMTRMFWNNHPCCVLTTSKKLFDSEQKMVQDVTRATTISGLLLDNIAFRKNGIAKIYDFKTPYQKIPLEYLQKAFKPRKSDFYPFPFLSSGEVIIQQMKKIKLLPEITSPKTLVKDVFQASFAMNIIKQAAAEAPGASIPSKPERNETFQLI
ncbi:ABC transporter substrate-binding protein [Candidatus Magnetomorum sp. HK-1]|nr:ABC transporter substrate-binding protein [Candidatus Magnetomorum sp. HK-1]